MTRELVAERKQVSSRRSVRNRYELREDVIQNLIGGLRRSALWVSPRDPLPLRSRDLKDDKFLAAALSGRAEYLASGDQDLLALAGDTALGNLCIVTAREFLELSGI